MARKKTDKENNEQNVDTGTQTVEQQLADTKEVETQTPQEADKVENSTPDKTDKDDAAQTQKKEIPAVVDKLLKAYKNYKRLYIDSKGSVYSEGTKPNLMGGAILYQNPYYKS